MRRVFREKIKCHTQSGKPLVYIDESGFAHDMPRTHGYALKGQKCYGSHDWNAKGRTNAIGAMLGATLLTVCLFSCNINSDVFYAWLKYDLLPQAPPGAVLIMDNATFHKRIDIKEEILNAGHSIEYLPPYSPDLNPIEHKWPQAKNIRRTQQCSTEELFLNQKI